MASETDICNRALLRIGSNPIDSLDDVGKTADHCRLFYPLCRDMMLREFDFRFARAEQALVLTTDSFAGYSYAYQAPPDCLMALRVADTATAALLFSSSEPLLPLEKPDFDVVSNKAKTAMSVLSNTANATLIYTAKITNPTLFDPLFANALSWYLASELALPLQGSISMQQNFYNMYLRAFNRAAARSGNEGSEAPSEDSPLARSRL